MKTITTPLRHSFILATLALFLAGTGGLRAGTAGIQDNAGFFSAEAKADAQGNITLAQRTLKKDVLFETFAAVPDEVKRGVNLQDKAAVNKMFEQWALQRFKAQAVNGVYVLIVKEPAHLQAEVGNETQKVAFTRADRDVLVKGMLEKMRARDFDGALRHGASFVVTTMKKHAPGHVRSTGTSVPTSSSSVTYPPAGSHPAAQKSSGFPWGWIIALVVLFFVVRLVMGLFRALFRGGMGGGAAGNPMGGQMGGGGGGGFMRSLMGGVLGAAAGSWMYDNFFGSHGSSAYGAPPQDRFDSSDSGGYSGQDTDASGSGGSFGDDSSGGGGGFDSGGGGDFGGGGGDSGGGGGDF